AKAADPAVEVAEAADVERLQVHLRELRLLLEPAPRVGPEVLPRLVDRREAPLERGRCDQVQVDRARVGVERRQALSRLLVPALAEPARAELRLRLDDGDPVAPPEPGAAVVRGGV